MFTGRPNQDIKSSLLLYMMMLCMLVSLCLGLARSQSIVDTEYGQVRGHFVNVNNTIEQTAVEVFYGIPFAQPPVGDLRFRNPVAPDPWVDILEADTIRDQCAQTGGSGITYSEDCLYVNIYTPDVAGGPYPVMFWIYGGSYQWGDSWGYPGHYLASLGAVVVTANYRLSAFGFSFTGNDACPGNAGLWDQTAVLQFIANNIANFGGDPNRVTVFGESAGATSVSLLMLSPHSKDLFHQALPQSGSETTDWGLNPPISNPETYTRQMAEGLGCDQPDDYDMMDCLRQLPFSVIRDNAAITCTPGFPECLGMAPVVDGSGGFLPQLPSDLRKSGNIMKGPLLAGINEEDASLFYYYFSPGMIAPDCCNKTYYEISVRNFVDMYQARLTSITEDDLYHAMHYQYTSWPHLYENEVNRQRLVKLYTDQSYGVFWDRQMKEHQSVAPTYGYLYDYMWSNSSYPEWMGTVHGAELTFTFGYPLMAFNPEVRDDAQWLGSTDSYNAMDVQYAMFMMELWTNFAKYGNPTPSPVPNPLGGTTVWPQFTQNQMDILYLGAEDIGPVTEYSQKEYAFWSQYIIWIAGDELEIKEQWPSTKPCDPFYGEVPEYCEG